MSVQNVSNDRIKYVPTAKRTPDELWDEIRFILASEKLANTIGTPAISFRKVLDGTYVCLKN